MMLKRCSGKDMSMPFQKQVVAADVIVMPRSCSCSIRSIVAAPSYLADRMVDAGEKRMRSVVVVLPASM